VRLIRAFLSSFCLCFFCMMIGPLTDVPQVKELALTLPFSSFFCFLFPHRLSRIFWVFHSAEELLLFYVCYEPPTREQTHTRARACAHGHLFPYLQPVRHCRRRHHHHTTTLSEGWGLENHRKRRCLRVRGMGCCSHLTRSRAPRTRTSACFCP
jgi:hypothetical protein